MKIQLLLSLIPLMMISAIYRANKWEVSYMVSKYAGILSGIWVKEGDTLLVPIVLVLRYGK